MGNPPQTLRLVGNCGVLHLEGGPDHRLDAIAARQHGVVGRQQLLQAGLSARQIEVRLKRGQLTRVHHGVYAVGGAAAGHGQLGHGQLGHGQLAEETAAILACGHRAALSHLTALNLWHLLPQPTPLRGVHVSAETGQLGRLLDGITLHRVRSLPATQIRSVSGLPATSPERTLLDCAPLLSARQLERALDEALAQRLTGLNKLQQLVASSQRSHGHGRLRALVTARSGAPAAGRPRTLTDSDAEEALLELIRTAGLPDPQLQSELCGFRVDAYWPQANFAVEIDGFQWHSTKSNFERDRRKEQALRDHGIALTRTTWDQIQDEPLRLAAHLARHIGISA